MSAVGLVLLMPASRADVLMAWHSHGESCACAMQDPIHPFSIDCSEAGAPALRAAEQTLLACAPTAKACAMLDETGIQPCQSAFYTLQAYHDHCEHDEAGVETHIVHEYEHACHSCTVPRRYESEREGMCPLVDCDDKHLALLAYHTLNAACTASKCCSTEDEVAAFLLLTSYHDECDASQIPSVALVAWHSFEELCEAHLCNMVDASFDPLECVANDGTSASANHPFVQVREGNAPPLWADALLGQGTWLIVMTGMLLVGLCLVGRDVRAIKKQALSRVDTALMFAKHEARSVDAVQMYSATETGQV
eukprot:CAMPEP_0119317056 /NCGR_PEP_ID=MMETSP1333-20130426/41823_1 /TAXON_ID=418940 /ORGANISM="Scyphosphaera apsteinii, Strain RCC1455" /LENGTH=307 /DNA_ID=CAMNT_0007322877 /DNA_START=36 /DNA_END=959 /DNA_ORIENTATION=-